MNLDETIRRLSIIGNSGAGKTVLSRRLHVLHGLPLCHVDAIQFTQGMQIRKHSESIAALREIQQRDSWIIEGFGPLDILEERLHKSDCILLIDFPLWRHFYWSLKRQIYLVITGKQRDELPDDCYEGTWTQTKRLVKSLRNIHYKMRPEMLRILQRDSLKNKVYIIRTRSEWDLVFQNGFRGLQGLKS